MIWRSHLLLAVAVCLLFAHRRCRCGRIIPKPSPYPVSWELTLTHSDPKRILVQGPGDTNPAAYWYITYHVVNNTDRDKILFYPSFEMMLEDGRVIRSDMGISPAVFDAIKQTANT